MISGRPVDVLMRANKLCLEMAIATPLSFMLFYLLNQKLPFCIDIGDFFYKAVNEHFNLDLGNIAILCRFMNILD